MLSIDFNQGWTVSDEAGRTREVTLPHDAMLYEQRAPEHPSGSGGAFFPGGIYTYEKQFDLPAAWSDKLIQFRFEGVYKNSTVYLNGERAGGCAYGYSQFYVPAGDLLKMGQTNTIKVIADNSDHPNSRWYTGSGIYRPVTMLVQNRQHIHLDGVRITTLSHQPAKIHVSVATDGGDRVDVAVLDGTEIVAQSAGSSVELEIPSAKLWSDRTPHLYRCRVRLLSGSEVVDEVTESFGIRTIQWSTQGLFINGEQVLLRGGCVHHDNGILGACSFEGSEWRKARILKEAGFNAIRSAHNPASKALLRACDQLGLYVMDETWDMWYNRKTKHDYAGDFEQHYAFDLQSLVQRDYNHPSVIMYSIGNEVSEPATEKGQELTRELVRRLHALDSTRPVTAGMNLMIISRAAKGKPIFKEDGGLSGEKSNSMEKMNSTMFNMLITTAGKGMNKASCTKAAGQLAAPSLDALDIAGYNYASGRYEKDARLYPDRVIVGAETFHDDIVRNWKLVTSLPHVIGDFMWTAWDYLGEVGIGAWAYTSDGKGFNNPYPWLLAGVGALDLLGDPNGAMFLAQAAWGQLKQPRIAVQPVNHPGVRPLKAIWRGTNAIPSWAWEGCDGNSAVVEVYADGHTVELLLNGRRIGKRRLKDFKSSFKTTYQPGTLEAICYGTDGRELSRSSLHSATGGAHIRLQPEGTAVAGKLLYISVDIVGDNNIVHSNKDQQLSVTLEGGELLAFGSANPRTTESYVDGVFSTYYGRALAVVRPRAAGTLRVVVAGENLPEAVLELPVKGILEEEVKA